MLVRYKNHQWTLDLPQIFILILALAYILLGIRWNGLVIVGILITNSFLGAFILEFEVWNVLNGQISGFHWIKNVFITCQHFLNHAY